MEQEMEDKGDVKTLEHDEFLKVLVELTDSIRYPWIAT
jgi:hypothetical protein